MLNNRLITVNRLITLIEKLEKLGVNVDYVNISLTKDKASCVINHKLVTSKSDGWFRVNLLDTEFMDEAIEKICS